MLLIQILRMIFIWTLSIICMSLAIRNFACCVGASNTFKLSSQTRLQMNCQRCLLLVGATRVEEREIGTIKAWNELMTDMVYMWVWGSDSLLTNIMACQTLNTCRQQSFNLLSSQIVTSGKIGSTSTLIQKWSLPKTLEMRKIFWYI